MFIWLFVGRGGGFATKHEELISRLSGPTWLPSATAQNSTQHDFYPCLTKQEAQVQIPLILDNKITLSLLIAAAADDFLTLPLLEFSSPPGQQ